MGFFKDIGKALLIFINTIFLLLGWILIGSGIYLIKTNYLQEIWLFQEHLTTRISTFFIVIGCVTTVIAFLGFWGASTDKRWMLKIYASILLSVLFIQVCVGIFIGVLMTTDQDGIKAAFTTKQTDSYDIFFMDAIHLTYECCGYDNPETMQNEHGLYPASCCGLVDEEFDCKSPPTYNTGCLEQITESVTKAGLTYAAFVGFQILCAAIAFFVAFSIPKKRDSEDDSSSYRRMSL